LDVSISSKSKSLPNFSATKSLPSSVKLKSVKPPPIFKIYREIGNPRKREGKKRKTR